MKTASTALINLLVTRQFYSADLYNFTLAGGGNSLFYCGGDRDVTWNGVTWSSGVPNGPFIDRKDNKAKCHWKIGVEVDTLVFDVLPGASTVTGEPFLSAVRQGVFDGAELTLYRAFMPTYGNTATGTVTMFAGRVAEIDAGRSLATFSVNSHLELLNLNMPRNLYQAGCVNTLFDAGCGLSLSAFGIGGSVQSASSTQISVASALNADGYFNLGSLTFTSGANAGVSRSVKTYGNTPTSTFHLMSPFPTIALAGDSFTAYPGCDKQQATCMGKFRNLANFRGFPYVPENSTAI